MGKKPAPPDRKQLRQTIIAFIEAGTWPESKRFVERCPELLSGEADALLQHFIVVAHEHGNTDAEHIFSEHRELLHRCRLEGVEAAFASLTQLAKLTTSGRPTPEIPPEFAVEIRALIQLTEQVQRDPELHGQQVTLIERLLQRLRPGQYLAFRASLLNEMGNAYRSLPTGDRAANLQQAIACYREALTVYTPEAAPLDYAATQNNLGHAYTTLPTGDRTANLQQAIACYQEALTVYTPEAAPGAHRMTTSNVGDLHFRESHIPPDLVVTR